VRQRYRTEQLCGFLGDMHVMRLQKRDGNHMPIMLSWAQAKAIEQHLLTEGFSAWGYHEPAKAD